MTCLKIFYFWFFQLFSLYWCNETNSISDASVLSRQVRSFIPLQQDNPLTSASQVNRTEQEKKVFNLNILHDSKVSQENLDYTIKSINKVKSFPQNSLNVEEVYERHKRIENVSSRQVDHIVSDSMSVTPNETMLISDSGIATCVHPEYLVFTWVMCLVALATTLKLYFLIKTLLALVMVSFYAFLVVSGYPNTFLDESL